MSENLKLFNRTNQKNKNKKILFGRNLQDSPIVLLISSILYGLLIYLYYNFRLNPLWSADKSGISNICTPEDMSGCTAERAIELERELDGMSKKPTWWEKNKLHILDMVFSLFLFSKP